jgi:hypothetical protein
VKSMRFLRSRTAFAIGVPVCGVAYERARGAHK